MGEELELHHFAFPESHQNDAASHSATLFKPLSDQKEQSNTGTRTVLFNATDS
jgi:hypothetical protein